MSVAAITGVITEAIDELRQTFPDASVTFEPDGGGGAWVNIDPVPTGPAYTQQATWIAFQITYPYPEADIYPLFVQPDLTRKDGAGHGEGFQSVAWGPRAQPGIQLSRRSNRLDPAVDTAATKVLKVLRWLAQQ